MPFAAKFGHSAQDLIDDPGLEDRLMDAYARSYGHESDESWILVVHADGSSDFMTFAHGEAMWCCELRRLVRHALREQVAAYFPEGVEDLGAQDPRSAGISGLDEFRPVGTIPPGE